MTKKNNLTYFFTILFCFILHQSNAQNIRVTASLHKNKITIGDQVYLTLEAKHSKDVRLRFPIYNGGDTLIEQIEVVEQLNLDTFKNENNEVLIRQELLVTSFDSGSWVIPSFPFLLKNGEKTDTVFSNQLQIEVGYPIITKEKLQQIDTTQQHRVFDVKKPIDTPLTFAEIWQKYGVIIIVSLFVILTVIFAWFFIHKKKTNQPVIPKPKPQIPPHVTALKQLDKLKAKNLWQQDKIKQYHSELTDIIRTYIEHRFNIQALELTSDEILNQMRFLVQQENSEKLKRIFFLADLAKFAKMKPLPNENAQSIELAYQFVQDTKLIRSQSIELKQEPTNEKIK